MEGDARAVYAAEGDAEVTREGHPTIRVHPIADPGGAYGTFMTSLDAAPLRGRRARAIVWVKTQGVTGRGDAWLRAQGSDSPNSGSGLASAVVRLAPSADFTRYEVIIPVADDADKVQFGLGIAGPGMLWMDGLKIESLP